jgi:hypothetical protein
VTPSAVRALALGGFLVAGLAGWKLAAPELPSSTSSPSSLNTRPSSGRIRQSETSGPPAWARASVAAIQQAAAPEDRLRRILALANAVPVSEIPKWLDGRWFHPGEGFEPTFFTELLLKRWESADPLAMAHWRMQSEPHEAEPVLMRFANTDPEAVIALLKERPSGHIEINVLSEMAKNHPEIAWDRFMELVSRDMGNSAAETNTTSFLHAMAKTHPAMLEAALGQLPAFWNDRAKDALVGQRLMDHFDEEIRKLWNSPDGWMRFSNNLSIDGMADKLFGELPNLPASWRQSIANGDWFIWKDAGKWWHADLEGSGFTPEQARKIRMTALKRMSQENPETAIASMDGIELSVSERADLLQSIFLRAQVTPEDTAGLLKLLPTEEDREAARAISDRRTTFVAVPAIVDPAEWLTAFGNADPKSSEFHQYRNMTRLWEPEKAAELGTRIRGLPEDQKLKVAGLLKSQWCDYGADDQPFLHGEALRCLATHPDQFPDLVQSTSIHAVKWAQNDPAAASEWVRSLPNGEARQWAEKNLAAYLEQVDPDAARQWLGSQPNETLEKQPEEKR